MTISNAFYLFGVVLIMDYLFILFKKKGDLPSSVDVNINDLPGELRRINKFSFFLTMAGLLWIIAGLFTPFRVEFVILVFSIPIQIFNPHKAFVPITILKIVVIGFILYLHFSS